ncbi:MAG: replication-associated recombination protein A [Candidatus Rokubacteria bacterium]|nr:replication-associated recombination protein A [Candidatus Rokubacteria bacterium]
MRPRTLGEFVGQPHLLSEGRALRAALETGDLHSMILWGPPGSGKTTLAALLAAQARAHFTAFSAVLAGVKEIRAVIGEAEERLRLRGQRTVLFVDEIHRFNKAQQDAFLPHVERGTLILIGATTENPSFEVISALLSRCRVYVLHRLTEEEITTIVRGALADVERGLGTLALGADPEPLAAIARLADGDARSALNVLEVAARLVTDAGGDRRLTAAVIEEAAQRKALLYDKAGEEHYNLISALHKSVRDSDPDGALYWLARMLEAGEDPLYVARRLCRMAVEDVGLADPQALAVTLWAKDAYDFLGTPEGELALAEAAVYLACAPKSNAVYTAFGEAREDVHARPAEPVPLHLRNAPTRLMRDLGYGREYRYAHDAPEAAEAQLDQEHLPEALRGRRYYHPVPRGVEAEIRERLERWRRLRERARASGGTPEGA